MGWVLFFDGDCAFCSSAVRKAVEFDRHRVLKFAPLQGKLAGERGFSKFADKMDGSMVLMRESDGKVFLRSDAAIELARALGGWWRLLIPTALIPSFLRDAVYNWIARHRYWFAEKGNFCSLPDPELEKRLLE